MSWPGIPLSRVRRPGSLEWDALLRAIPFNVISIRNTGNPLIRGPDSVSRCFPCRVASRSGCCLVGQMPGGLLQTTRWDIKIAIPLPPEGWPMSAPHNYVKTGGPQPGRLTRGYQAVSLEITESRVTTSPPEPKFFVKFILGPEPDSRIRRKKLHTGHRSSQNRFFENLYKSLFPSLNMPGNPPEHAQIIPRSSPEPPKIDPKTAQNPGMLIVFPI